MLINFTSVQNILARKGTDWLSKKLKTKVEIRHVRIDFINHLLLQGLYIEDQAHDTLLYAGEAQVRITDVLFSDKDLTLRYIGLQNAYAHLYRAATSKEWNYGFIEDAFSTGKKDTTKKAPGKPFEFDLEKIELENVRIHMDDAWVGEDLDFDIGYLLANARDLDFGKEILDIKTVNIANAHISVNEYKGGRPPRAKVGHPWQELPYKTPFNPGNWAVQVDELSLDSCTFRFKGEDHISEEGHFDETNFYISGIQLAADEIKIKGDTLRGNLNNLSARERCGIVIKTLRSKVTVSPNASICENLYLETNYSKIKDYYAMHYLHFPAFNYYIDSVTMVAHLRDASIDQRDIAFFAPQIRNLPATALKVSGDGRGTVASLAVKRLNVTDGNSVIKGNLSMKGLPDIYATKISFTDAEITTTGNGILHYAPALKDNPNIAVDRLLFAHFKGNYEGTIEDFALKGTITTNLGNINTDLKMQIPDFDPKKAAYSGTVAADNVQVGDFLRQSWLGGVTLKEEFSGTSFDPDDIQLKIDGSIQQIRIDSYTYHNISTHGVVAKKQFKGNVLIDDPNLALEFNGDINYGGKNLAINATAHLLAANFKALHLTKDTVTLSADFDLNCTGSNIDNFSGYAKLNNIDLKRNAHKLALDSILVNATGDSVNRYLSIQSNDVTATINGSYQLSKLPASVQLYLSRYIPNYIQPPTRYAPNQNFEFTITTNNVDSLFAVTLPILRGFNSSKISGGLNMTSRKLTLKASVPHAAIGNFSLYNIALQGQGDFDALSLNTTVDNVVIGDSILNGSLSLNTTVAHDSIAFTVTTSSSDTTSSLSLNGNIQARRDSLFLTILPSQFYLNQAKWNIAGGSKVVYSDKYLQVEGISITSGLQKITAATELRNNERDLVINTENLDLGQFGNWAGLAAYQPDGRLSGNIRINKIFERLFIDASVKATDVKFNNIDVGTVNIIGNYDNGTRLLHLDPRTGIFNKDASVTASGTMSFDSTSKQKIDGKLTFKNTPVAWATPFLTGVMSNLGGTIEGAVDIKGTAVAPDIEGKLNLFKGAFKLDYMGTNYTIPFANVTVNNRRIELGKVMIFDRNSRYAILSGYFSHNLFNNMRSRIKVTSDNFEVMNLASYDNNLFYGNVLASFDSITLRGQFNNLRLNVYNIAPAAKSRIFIPVNSSGEAGSYSYVSFKNYSKTQDKILKKRKDKFSVSIDANLNTLAEMVIVLDPSNGDEIRAKGDGRIQMDIPANNDMTITGLYIIDHGTYTFTLNQFFIRRTFTLDGGSTISFNGPFSSTELDVDATYRVKARLADLLTESEKAAPDVNTQAPQWVNVKLHMFGPLEKSSLTFNLDLEDKHAQNSIAYTKLRLVNADARQQLTQVGSLLLVGQFIPPEGIGSGTALSGTVNNISQIFSSSVSTGLTAIVNKLTGDKDLNVAVKYTNYADQTAAGSRSEIKLGVNKSLLNDRLIVEVGSTSNWGRPTSTTSSSSGFNVNGDFRVQYKITPTSGLRLNAFRTSDYDATLDRSIVRSGLGMSWRKSFDNLPDFFRGKKYAQREREIQLKRINEASTDTVRTLRRNGSRP
ncbi:MAG: hypothetical protein K0Q79_816 [Flavipsychrobacter sp.]|nr:hypothetical protein [Flavipsychrobacter sp.]